MHKSQNKKILSATIKINAIALLITLLAFTIFILFYAFIPSGFNEYLSPTVLTEELSAINVKEIPEEEIVSGEFRASGDNLAIFLTPFSTHNKGALDTVNFKLKNVNQKKWYFEHTYNAYQFTLLGHLLFGFPQIQNSQNNSYEFELDLKPKKGINVSAINTNLQGISVGYKFSKNQLFSDKSTLLTFVYKKFLIAIRNIKLRDLFIAYVISLCVSFMILNAAKILTILTKILNFLSIHRYYPHISLRAFIKNEGKDSKIAYLDGLRGWAAFIVVVNHYFIQFYPAIFSGEVSQVHLPGGIEIIIANSPLNIFFNGNFAVCIFFILSGFVLTHKFFVVKNYELVVSGAARRYFRLLFPVVLTSVLAYLLMRFSLFDLNPQGLSTSWIAGFWNFKPDFLQMIYEAFIGSFLYNNQHAYNPVLWTMYYEFFGSMLVFAVAALFYKISKRYFIYILLIYLTINTFFVAFILGVLLADLSVNKPDFFNKIPKLIVLSIFLLGLFIGSYPFPVDASTTIYKFMVLKTDFIANPVVFYQILGAFLLFITVLSSKRIKSILSHKFSVYLGKTAFSMYATHLLILASFSTFLFGILIQYVPYNVATLIVLPTSLALILISSLFTFEYVDLKGIAFSKFIYDKYLKVVDER